MAVSRLTGIKILELVVTLVCLGLHYNTMGEATRDLKLLTAGTYVGYSIILLVLMAGYLMNTPVNKRLDIFLSIVAIALFLYVGIKVIDFWDNKLISWDKDEKNMAMAKGGLSIVNAVLFLIDVVFTFRD